jgi:hypothetical protein
MDKRGIQTKDAFFSYKGSDGKQLGFVGHVVSIRTIQLLHYSTKCKQYNIVQYVNKFIWLCFNKILFKS